MKTAVSTGWVARGPTSAKRQSAWKVLISLKIVFQGNQGLQEFTEGYFLNFVFWISLKIIAFPTFYFFSKQIKRNQALWRFADEMVTWPKW
jgi:hypothetical protein